MRFRALLIVGLSGVTFALGGCGASDEDEALTLAASACTDALADVQAGQDDADMVEARASAADVAAQAANLDTRWDSLVEAATGWEQTTRQLVDMTADLDSMTMITMGQMADDLSTS